MKFSQGQELVIDFRPASGNEKVRQRLNGRIARIEEVLPDAKCYKIVVYGLNGYYMVAEEDTRRRNSTDIPYFPNETYRDKGFNAE